MFRICRNCNDDDNQCLECVKLCQKDRNSADAFQVQPTQDGNYRFYNKLEDAFLCKGTTTLMSLIGVQGGLGAPTIQYYDPPPTFFQNL